MGWDDRGPRLSVIMPVYNVARWLPECLDSIAAQDYRNWELIVIDDGSPDNSVELIEQWAAGRDVRILRQPNAGLGAARNRGLAEATGELVAFVDSDDVLPPQSWSRLVRAVDGVDIAIGRADRWDGARQWTTPLMQRNHAVPVTGASISSHPLLLADVFAWNKVYQRAVWQTLRFPEGIRYEDQPALTRALLTARLSVITEPVYWWRSRPESITSAPKDLADLRDRLTTKESSLAAVRESGDAHVETVFVREVLPIDMWEYFRGALRNGDEYWRTLVTGTRRLWEAFDDTAVPAQQRLMGWLVTQGRRDDLATWIASIDAHGVRLEGGVLQHPWMREVVIPADG